MVKLFTLKVNGKTAIDLSIQGDDDLVEAFVKTVLTDTFGAFYKSREAFTEKIIEGMNDGQHTNRAKKVS